MATPSTSVFSERTTLAEMHGGLPQDLRRWSRVQVWGLRSRMTSDALRQIRRRLVSLQSLRSRISTVAKPLTENSRCAFENLDHVVRLPVSIDDSIPRRFHGPAAVVRPNRRLVNCFDDDTEHISRAALSTDIARFCRIGLELAPQTHDLRVDGSVVHVIAM